MMQKIIHITTAVILLEIAYLLGVLVHSILVS